MAMVLGGAPGAAAETPRRCRLRVNVGRARPITFTVEPSATFAEAAATCQAKMRSIIKGPVPRVVALLVDGCDVDPADTVDTIEPGEGATLSAVLDHDALYLSELRRMSHAALVAEVARLATQLPASARAGAYAPPRSVSAMAAALVSTDSETVDELSGSVSLSHRQHSGENHVLPTQRFPGLPAHLTVDDAIGYLGRAGALLSTDMLNAVFPTGQSGQSFFQAIPPRTSSLSVLHSDLAIFKAEVAELYADRVAAPEALVAVDDLFQRLHAGDLLVGAVEDAVECFIQQGVDYLLEYIRLAVLTWDIDFVSKHCFSNTQLDYKTQYEAVLAVIRSSDADGWAEVAALTDGAHSGIAPVSRLSDFDEMVGERWASEGGRVILALYKVAVPLRAHLLALLAPLEASSRDSVVKMGNVKALARMLEKYVLRSGEIIWDSVRSMVICQTMGTVARALRFLLDADKRGDIEIVKLVNRFRRPVQGGWADISVYLRFRDPAFRGLIVEVQLVHVQLLEIRDNSGAHDSYGLHRFTRELVQYWSMLEPVDVDDGSEAPAAEGGVNGDGAASATVPPPGGKKGGRLTVEDICAPYSAQERVTTSSPLATVLAARAMARHWRRSVTPRLSRKSMSPGLSRDSAGDGDGGDA